VNSWGQEPAVITSLYITVGDASQLSVEVADPVLAGDVLAVHSMVILAGHNRLGTVLSSTVMIWLQELIFPHASVATQVRVIVFSWGHDPATMTSDDVIVKVEQLSVAVAVPVLAGRVLAVHWIVTFAGQFRDGGVLSSTKIV
jgi:hypothetical protein